MASLGSWLGAPYTSDTWDNSDLARMNCYWLYKPETAASTRPCVGDHTGGGVLQGKGNAGKKVQAEDQSDVMKKIISDKGKKSCDVK